MLFLTPLPVSQFFLILFVSVCVFVHVLTRSQIFHAFALRFWYCAFRVAGGRESRQVKLLQLRLSAQTHGQPSYSGKHTETAANLQLQYVGNIRCFALMAADLFCHTFQYLWSTKTRIHTYKRLHTQELHYYIRPVFCFGFVYILGSQESGLHWTTLTSHDVSFLLLSTQV